MSRSKFPSGISCKRNRVFIPQLVNMSVHVHVSYPGRGGGGGGGKRILTESLDRLIPRKTQFKPKKDA